MTTIFNNRLTPKQLKYGSFIDPVTEDPIEFQKLTVTHLEGVKKYWFLKTPRYRLEHAICYIDPKGGRWDVPGSTRNEDDSWNEDGFVFNGGSVPFIFWPVCSPDQPDAFAAFAVHDFLCTKPHPCGFKKAAWVFFCAMRANGYYALGALRNWAGVRLFGPRFKEDYDAKA